MTTKPIISAEVAPTPVLPTKMLELIAAQKAVIANCDGSISRLEGEIALWKSRKETARKLLAELKPWEPVVTPTVEV